MKYNLIYEYSTKSYHRYRITSRDPIKNGRYVYIPRDISFDDPLVETDIIIEEPKIRKDGKKRTKAIERNIEIPF